MDFTTWFHSFTEIYYALSVWFFVAANCFYLVILGLGFLNARSQYCDQIVEIATRLGPLKALKPISILVPCHNEEMTVVDSVQAMLRIDYPNYEVIVCNDGSSDQTMAVLIKEFDLRPIQSFPPQVLPCRKKKAVYHSKSYSNLIVIDKENGGKADALNAAINFSQYPLICCVDSDSIIDRDGLINVSMPFLEEDHVVATGGTILLANTESVAGTQNFSMVNTQVTPTWMGMIQSVEYLRAFLVGRLGWDYLGCNAIISGAFGLFKKSLVIKVGGYATGTIGEDMELLIRLQSYCLAAQEKFAVRLLPVPVCWTEPPTDLKTLRNQRIRWTQGLLESLWLHRKMIFRPWAKKVGLLALPYYLFFELISAPAEIAGYLILGIGLALGIFDWSVAWALMAATVLFGCVLNLGAVVIDQVTFQKYSRPQDTLKLLAGAILEHFGFRQLHLIWRLQGILRWFRGKQQWGEMKRVGVRGKNTPEVSPKKAA